MLTFYGVGREKNQLKLLRKQLDKNILDCFKMNYKWNTNMFFPKKKVKDLFSHQIEVDPHLAPQMYV